MSHIDTNMLVFSFYGGETMAYVQGLRLKAIVTFSFRRVLLTPRFQRFYSLEAIYDVKWDVKMLYISKQISDKLPKDVVEKISHLSLQRQTLFECFYYRFGEDNLQSRMLLNILMDYVLNYNFVSEKDKNKSYPSSPPS